MHDFGFRSPRSLNEALELLASARGQTQALAGGTDLLVQMKRDLRQPNLLVDVKRIPELNRLELVAGRGLVLGAAVPLARVLEFPPVKERFGMLAQACALIGSVQVRNRASVGGNLCNAAPSADAAPPLICLGARATIASLRGRREVRVEDFFLGPGRTVLEPDELLVELGVPLLPDHAAGAYLRHTTRAEMDIAVAGAGSFLVMADGRCREARIALAAVAPTPVRAKEAERFLAGKVLDDETLAEASERAARAARPISDLRGSAEYRRELVKVLVRRTLRQARGQIRSNAA